MIFFEKQGLHPLPAPANQMAIDAPLNTWERVIPSPMWLMHSDLVGYETLGRLWQWLKGSSGEPGQECFGRQIEVCAIKASGVNQLRNFVPQQVYPAPPEKRFRNGGAMKVMPQ